MAASVDGYVAVHDGQTDSERHNQGFSNEADWQNLLNLIKSCDAVILGSQTLQAGGGVIDQTRDDGSWPIWVTLTNRGIPEEHEFWDQTEAQRWLVSEKDLDLPKNKDLSTIKNLVYHEKNVVSFILENLKSVGCKRVLLLGGGRINQMFYQAEAVQELILTVCPLLVAREGAVPIVSPGLETLVKFRLLSSRTEQDLVFLHYEINKN